MDKLPTGLKMFEPSDTVRRIAQNENIEAIDKLFRDSTGHRHSGRDGDAPQIGKDGIEIGAIERNHLRKGRLSENIAKYKPVKVTSGIVMGMPTATYYQKSQLAGDEKNCWLLSEIDSYPASLTIELKGIFTIEAISFYLADGPYPIHLKVEIGRGPDDSWKVVSEGDFGPYESPYIPVTDIDQYSYVRITVNQPTWQSYKLRVSELAVYSQDFIGNEDDPLEDRRPWGLAARLQGFIGITDYPLYDYGDSVTLTGHWFIVNPVTNASICIYGDATKKYPLANGDYLYIDFKYFSSNQNGGIYPSVGKSADFMDPIKPYEYPDRWILMTRSSTKLYFNPIIKATVEKRSALNLSQSNDKTSNNKITELNIQGAIKNVQRGVTHIPPDSNAFDIKNRRLWISPVQIDKAVLRVTPRDPNYNGYIYDGSLKGRFVSNSEIEITIGSSSELSMFVWEVVEYV
ncbi:hypothetical protein [Paenibacillus sp. DYY-L-2]|uniref:hypothetical protein n=1 Tax=Paenibacillus sp. DYY-L-2 TaxID=3447013 RepID=UPI003F4F9470